MYCAAWILFQVRPQQPNTAFQYYPFVCIEAFGKCERNKQEKLCVFTAKAGKNLIIKNRNANKTTEFLYIEKAQRRQRYESKYIHTYTTLAHIQRDMFTFS